MNDTKYEIPDDLKAAWDVLPQNCWERQLIERMAELLSENKRLSAPVSDEEYRKHFFTANVHPLYYATRADVDKLLAARQSAKELQL